MPAPEGSPRVAPVAVDAMGGDKAPGVVIEGALQAVARGNRVILVGRPEEIVGAGDIPVHPASEVISMEEDPAKAVRQKKDSSLLRAAELVRDGEAAAMVSAGNTGAAMASALLRFGRLPGVVRPAIAVPVPGGGPHPVVLLDAGANSECTAQMLVQFARMGAVYASERYGIALPRVGLLSIGEEPGKGSPLVKEAHKLLAAGGAGSELSFVGNVEGRDIMTGDVDVIVTDGFTGNTVLKTLEGGMAYVFDRLMSVFNSNPESREAASVLLPLLAPEAERLNPDSTGGAILLGVDGVCIISHGASSAHAVEQAIQVARDLADHGIVAHLARALSGS